MMSEARRNRSEASYSVETARHFAAEVRRAGPVPLPDVGVPYRPRPRIRVKCWTRPHVPEGSPPMGATPPAVVASEPDQAETINRMVATGYTRRSALYELATRPKPHCTCPPMVAPRPRVRVPVYLLATASAVAYRQALYGGHKRRGAGREEIPVPTARNQRSGL